MTCIVGISDGTKVWMGGDSASVDGWGTVFKQRGPKVFRRDKLLIGGSGSWRMMQLLAYPELPQPQLADSATEFMISSFVPWIRNLFEKGGFLKKKDEQEQADGHLLVAFGCYLFTVWGDMNVAEPLDGYTAIGSGDEIALGALWGMRVANRRAGTDMAPRDLLDFALTAAGRFKSTVEAPFHILST